MRRRAMLAASAVALAGATTGLVSGVDRASAATRRETRVDDYGAKGDGRTDDIRAIRRAVAALRDGGTLRFSSGKTYLTSATVLIAEKADISVIAQGATIVTTAHADDSAVMRLDNCRDVHVVGGHLRHKDKGVRRHDADGLDVHHCSDVLVERVHVGYVYSIGIRASGSRRVRITGCTVNGSVADGIGVYGGQRQPRIPDGAMAAGSTALHSPRCRFRVQDIGSTITITGAGANGGDLVTRIVSRQSRNRVTLAKPARRTVHRQFVKIQRPSTDVSIVGNTVSGTGDDAISSVGYLTYSAPNSRILIEDNAVTGSRARGILLTGTSHAEVSGNRLRRIAMGGIFLVSEIGDVTTWGSHDIAIHGNTMTTVGTAYPAANYPGIGASSVVAAHPIRDVRITGNVIRDAYSYYIGVGGNRNNPAIQVIRSKDVSILQNRIERARASAVTVTADVGGRVVVRGNVVVGYDRGRAGWRALDVAGPVPEVANNVIDGMHVAAGTTVPQHG